MDQMFETSVSNPQSTSPSIAKSIDGNRSENTRLRVKKKTVQAMLEEFQRAIEDLNRSDSVDVDRDPGTDCEEGGDGSVVDRDADELCDLVRSRVEGKDFLKKLESVHGSIPQNIPEEGNSWDIVGDNDLWEGGIDTDPDQDDYVLVSQEDIVDGMACFMAAYLLSLKETKDLNPSQLQQALSKTFSVKKKRGKLLKAWNGSKVIYNVASWGATAIGIYQNPALVRAASTAFWTSCHIISKLF